MSLIHNIVYLIWLICEVGFSVALRSKPGDQKGTDRNSLRILWVVIIVSIQAAVFMSFAVPAQISAYPYLSLAGLGIIVLGIVLRILAIASLGRMFTVDVTIREDHQLKQDGIYAYLRHPSYAASLLSFTGFALSLNNWVSIPIVLIPVVFAFMVRIRIEEQALISAFGDKYRTYRHRTRALIPFIY